MTTTPTRYRKPRERFFDSLWGMAAFYVILAGSPIAIGVGLRYVLLWFGIDTAAWEP